MQQEPGNGVNTSLRGYGFLRAWTSDSRFPLAKKSYGGETGKSMRAREEGHGVGSVSEGPWRKISTRSVGNF